MNILYLTWGENIGFSGLFREQVVGQLKQIKSLNPKMNLFLVSGIPISRNLLKRYKEYVLYLKDIKSDLNFSEIKFNWTYIPIFSTQFYSKFFIIPFYYICHFFYLKRFIKAQAIDIVHCRSYHATLFTYLIKNICNLNIKIIFDTRGVFPEEAVYFNFLSSNLECTIFFTIKFAKK